MEAEARTILTAAVARDEETGPNLAQAIRERFAALGGVDLDLPPRHDMPRTVTQQLSLNVKRGARPLLLPTRRSRLYARRARRR